MPKIEHRYPVFAHNAQRGANPVKWLTREERDKDWASGSIVGVKVENFRCRAYRYTKPTEDRRDSAEMAPHVVFRIACNSKSYGNRALLVAWLGQRHQNDPQQHQPRMRRAGTGTATHG